MDKTAVKNVTAPGFLFGAHYEIDLLRYQRVVLSIPSIDCNVSLQSKDLLSAGTVSTDGKYTLEEHLRHLETQKRINPKQPLLVISMRNNLVNWRCPVILGRQFYAVEGEQPERSRRPYYGIGFKDNKLVCDLVPGGTNEAQAWPEFFCAGVPVVWDDYDEKQLFRLMLCEAADHSHLFELPRGNHPLANDHTREIWQKLQDIFIDNLHQNEETASKAMINVVNSYDPPLDRSNNYLHAILGTRNDGSMICLFAQGRLEALGEAMKQRGCRRAICVENSGSIMPTFLPKGLKGEAIPLLHAPNFRPRGRALMVIELTDAGFASNKISNI